MKVVQIHVGQEERLRQIRLRSLLDAPDAFGSTYEEVQARPPESWTAQLRDLPTFIAVRDGEDIGIVRGCPDDTDPSRVWLISMWVAPTARGQGASTALVQTLIDWALQTNANELVLEVGSYNERARALYERMGFRETGKRRHMPPPRDHIVECEMVFSLTEK